MFKNLITILILVVAAAAGYYFLVLNGGAGLSGGVAASGEGDYLNQQFLNRIQRLERVEISRDLFTDERFRSLSSFSVEPTRANSGRANPFAR